MKYQEIAMLEITPPELMVRAAIDEDKVKELAGSIKQVGLLSPILVRRKANKFEVVAGHRRFLACQHLQRDVIPCLVLNESEAPSSAAKIHENLFREDITPVEEAAFYAELLSEYENDTNKLSVAVRRPRAHVEGRLNLLSGDPLILQALVQQEIGLGVAEELNLLKRPEDRKYYLGWARAQGANRQTVHSWRIQANIAAELNPGTPAALPAQPSLQGTDPPEPVCYICGHTEPRHDVEFWYIHRSCRQIAERARKEQMDYEHRRSEASGDPDGRESA